MATSFAVLGGVGLAGCTSDKGTSSSEAPIFPTVTNGATLPPQASLANSFPPRTAQEMSCQIADLSPHINPNKSDSTVQILGATQGINIDSYSAVPEHYTSQNGGSTTSLIIHLVQFSPKPQDSPAPIKNEIDVPLAAIPPSEGALVTFMDDQPGATVRFLVSAALLGSTELAHVMVENCSSQILQTTPSPVQQS